MQTSVDSKRVLGQNVARRICECLICAVLLLPMIFFPLTRDQGLFAYAGQVILDGGFPYTDVFDIKGPAVHYTYALAMALFGETELGVRLFFFLVAVAGSQVAAEIGERLVGLSARLPCALCYAVVAFQGDKRWSRVPWVSGQAEDLILPLTVLAILVIGSTKAIQSRRRLCVAGGLLGLTCLFKPTALLSCIGVGGVAIWALSWDRGLTRGDVFRKILWAIGGFFTPTALSGIYFAAMGVLHDFWAIVVLHNLEYVARERGLGLGGALGFYGNWWRGIVILAVVGHLLNQSGSRLLLRLLWAVLLGGFLAVVWQGSYGVYRWKPVVGCLAVLAGCGVGSLINAVQAWPNRGVIQQVARVVTMILIIGIGVPADVAELSSGWKMGLGVVTGDHSVQAFRAPFKTGATTAEITTKVAAYLKEHSGDRDTVMVWGHETLINFKANRRCPSRFTIDSPLSMEGEFRKARRAEFMEDMTQRPPLYIVVLENDRTSFEREDSMTSLRKFPLFRRFVFRNFVEEVQIERFHFFRRRAAPAAERS